MRKIALIAALVPFICGALTSNALATIFQPVITSFDIYKNGSAIFQDNFSGSYGLPPGGPTSSSDYSVFGPNGMTSEGGGKLTMTPSLGGTVAITSGFASKSTNATRSKTINRTDTTDFLGIDDTFTIRGTFDLTSLPSITGQLFGIRATDRALNDNNQGNNTIQLAVTKNLAGQYIVALQLLNFSNNSITLLNATSVDFSTHSPTAIKLILAKPAQDLNNNITGSEVKGIYQLINASGRIGSGRLSIPRDLISMANLYQGEPYIRGNFFSADLVPVPEPATLTLFGFGLVGLGWARRRRRTN